MSEKLRERTESPAEDPDYLNPAIMTKYFKPLKKLFAMNDIPFSRHRIYATFPELNNNSKTGGCHREEIGTLLRFARGAIERLIILIAANSGIRVGGLDLKWEDIQPVYFADGKLTTNVSEQGKDKAIVASATINVYKGNYAQYTGFITPEAYGALLNYKIEWTQEVGREPRPKDPLFKHEGNLTKKGTADAIRQRMERLLHRSSLRKESEDGKRRYEIPVMNGFRRFWNKTCKESMSKDSPFASLLEKEYVMSHTGLIKLDRNYFQTHVLELVGDYLTAVPALTTSTELRQEEQIKVVAHATLVMKSRLQLRRFTLQWISR